jgi:Fe2+ or Zn2+ uptake regulation protein
MFGSSYNRENLSNVLRGRGVNPTHQRIEIAHAIFSRGEHLSADQILALVNDRASETSKATVYNTLNRARFSTIPIPSRIIIFTMSTPAN